jgi:cyclic pyranopterin phosphate synthase
LGYIDLTDDIDLKNFCFFPFTQLLLQPTGTVSPCCWNQGIVLGKVPEQKLLDIWNGEPVRKLRREFLDGRPESCAQQMRHVGCHRFSRRTVPLEFERSEHQNRTPPRLDVRLNGKCNLKCVMCDVWSQPNGLYNKSDFWERGPSEIFPNLRELDVLGGEPFIQSDTYRLIDEVSAINPECTWAFVTNAHYKFGDAIRSRLDKISIRWMQVSLDSLNAETYSKVRRGGHLERVIETFNALLSYRAERASQGRGFRMMASMCVQRENWREIPEFLELIQGKNQVEPILQFAYDPLPVSLLGLPEEERRQIATELDGYARKMGSEPWRFTPVLAPLLDSLKSGVAL